MTDDQTPRDPSSPPPPFPAPITITVKPLGTIIVEGAVIVRTPEGTQLIPPPFKQPGVVKFCGCGRSGNKPFCDGSHKKVSGEQ